MVRKTAAWGWVQSECRCYFSISNDLPKLAVGLGACLTLIGDYAGERRADVHAGERRADVYGELPGAAAKPSLFNRPGVAYTRGGLHAAYCVPR